ncbi:protein ALTERED PHOSPHATE STARVATION RESPONSE 1-like [Magnolia sinica]|uniref:protein ALTERED PHOSPHATE STARVATION RESPONSE 1-like n=1 Tax=Magnolia sinica TaxID=86752 RepID=UPI0026592EFD|nr:protein ALTERED PHOSPHATE STARVATION RESPONSE 1-like [Magnolia sinica]
MGCTGSKLDDLPALVLCRERAQLLESAIRYRYMLSQSHLSYTQSLHSLGISLHRFFDVDAHNEAPLSPILQLPTQRKLDPDPDPVPVVRPPSLSSNPPQIPAVHHSRSNSGSHLHFHSSDSDNDSDAHLSPLHDDNIHGFVHDNTQMPPRYNAYYMQNRPTVPSVETVNYSEPSSSYSYPYNYSNYGYNDYGSLFGSASMPPPPQQQQPHYSSYPSSSLHPPMEPAAEASTSRPPPPPPSPPRASAWEFLNPFGMFESSYPTPYTPSRDSKDVREEEGIPDLEDEEYQHEVVKEVHGEQKLAADAADGGRYLNVENRGLGGDAVYQERRSGFGQSEEVEYEVHMVEKNVVANEERPPEDRRRNVGAVKTLGGSLSVLEVVGEIKAQFDRASESGSEVSKMLEVGKLPYRGKNAIHKVSSKMLDVITPLSVVSSQPSTSKSAEELPSSDNVSSLSVDFDKDMGMKSGNLSCTLEKLYIWEKKLYEEVKAEEKMRIIHERKSRRLQHLDEKGAESHKVDDTRTTVLKLSTKIRIAIQVVDSISNKISTLRDEELWPQTNELIQGLLRMWKVMLECHRSQCQIITEAKNLDAIASSRKFSDAHMKETVQLELDLLNWILSFYAWIGAQKGYVKALNGWLLKFIHYVPEQTVDGIAPFSPGRMGAPPVFVICNQWSQAMERISENEVFVAMRSFSMSVLQLWEHHNMVERQSMIVNKDMDSRIKALEREQQKMHKAVDTVNKKLVLVSEESGLPRPELINESYTANVDSLQVGLKQIFEAMEKFSAESMKAYEELHTRSEEERLAQENAKAQ